MSDRPPPRRATRSKKEGTFTLFLVTLPDMVPNQTALCKRSGLAQQRLLVDVTVRQAGVTSFAGSTLFRLKSAGWSVFPSCLRVQKQKTTPAPATAPAAGAPALPQTQFTEWQPRTLMAQQVPESQSPLGMGRAWAERISDQALFSSATWPWFHGWERHFRLLTRWCQPSKPWQWTL